MKKFKKIYLEITNVCNLKCAFCPQTKRKAEFMSEASFVSILDQVKPFADYLALHVKGEPLLHPHLGDFLDISGHKGFQVNITTNGTMIARLADMLMAKPAVRQINFSLHSFDGNQSQCSRDEYIDDILNFASRAVVESGMMIALRLWNLDQALLSEDQRARNLAIIHKIEIHFNLSYQIQSVLAATKSLKLAERVYLNQDYEFQWPDLAAAEGTAAGTCWGLRSHLAILVDGTVVPCCLDGEGVVNLGNIHEQKFSAILQSERAEAIKNGFCNKKIVEELCRKCGYRERFHNK